MNQHRFGVNAAYLGAKAARTPDERPGPAGWSGALLLDEFYRANGNPGLVTPTKAQAAWDDTFLYVLFLNWESAENADQVRRDIDELVVSSGTLGHRDFAVFSVGRNGEAHGVLESGMTYIGGDEAFGGSQPNLPFRHVGNQADIQTIDPQSYTVVVDHQAGFWSAAYKIPWTLVGGFPKGDCFAFQVYRKKQATGEIGPRHHRRRCDRPAGKNAAAVHARDAVCVYGRQGQHAHAAQLPEKLRGLYRHTR